MSARSDELPCNDIVQSTVVELELVHGDKIKRQDWAKLIKEEKMHNKINKQLNRNAIFV